MPSRIPTGTFGGADGAAKGARTLVEAMDRLAGETSRGFTFIDDQGRETSLSFSALHAEASRRAAHLEGVGLCKGDRVIVAVADPGEFVQSFLGAIRAGIVPVPIYPQPSLKNAEVYANTIRHIADSAGAQVLLTTDASRPFLESALSGLSAGGALRRILTVDIFHDDPPAAAAAEPVGPSDIAFLQFTSGSTSRPKGVVVRHENLAANAQSFMFHGLKSTPEDIGVSWLPLYHDMGLIGFVVGPLFANVQAVFLPTSSFARRPRVWLETIHKHKATLTWAPNFGYALVAKRLKDKDLQGLDLSRLRVAGCGAEPIQARTLREFADLLAPVGFRQEAFLPSYGMAEATLAISFIGLDERLKTDVVDAGKLANGEAAGTNGGGGPSSEVTCCGRPFPEHEVAIVGETGERLGERRVGEIVVRGPSTCREYFNDPEATAESFRDGWLYTGDLGYLANGEIYVCGRKKDLIIVRGRNFYPQDIEWVVADLPGVRRGNVVAFGRPSSEGDAHLGEQIVVVAEAARADAARLKTEIPLRVSEAMGLQVAHVEIVPIGSLPKTSSGKPQRQKTRAMFEAGEFVPRPSEADGRSGSTEAAPDA